MLPTYFSRAHFLPFLDFDKSHAHAMGCSATSKLDMSRKSGKAVGVRPGRSMLHWMNHCRNSSDMAKTGGKILNVTTEMLRKHSTLDDLWIAIQGKVYNVTPYVDFHPGGAEILLQAAGSDGTALFNKHHPWVNFDSILKNCFVGYLNKIFTPGEHQLASSQFLNCGKIVEKDIKCSWCRKLDSIELLLCTESQKLFTGMCIVCVTSTSVHLIIHLCNLDVMFNWGEQNVICKTCPVESKINQCTDGQVRINIKTLESIIQNGEIVKISKEISNNDKYQFKICKLEKIVKLAKDIFMFVLLLPFEIAVNVTIGCHMFWRLNDEKINNVQRPYTPVPKSMHEFENESFTCSLCFIIKLYDNGEMSSSIKHLMQGDQVEISRHFPSNAFDLVKLHNASKLIFLAAGTGLTPFCTLTPYSLKYTTTSEILILIFNERKCDIFFEEEFRLLSDRYAKRLKIVRFLSKPEKSDLEQRGRVSNAILQEHLPKFQTDYYTLICGPNGFCQAAAKRNSNSFLLLCLYFYSAKLCELKAGPDYLTLT
ncbi:Cytochrome b5 reductase 4, partial [Trichinella spiralis]